MSCISAKVIVKPRRQRYCDECHRRVEGPILRLYGSAETGDLPWVMWFHIECIHIPYRADLTREQNKIKNAIEAYKAKTEKKEG